MLILPIRILLFVIIFILLMLWIVSIIWVNRDARARGASVGFWTAIAIIPVAGLVAYCLLRPPLTSADATEQTMSIELMGRELSHYGDCPRCGRPVQESFIACPHCGTRLRNICQRCNRPLEPDWRVCPYCATPVQRPQRTQTRQ